MNKREIAIRSNALIDLKIGLSTRVKNEQRSYARITRTRRGLPNVDFMEARSIATMSQVLSVSFAPFALLLDGQAHHWPASQPSVERALASIPLDMRVALAGRGSTCADEIAERIFHTVDTDFRLIPLATAPGYTGTPRWEEIFQQEYGEHQHR